MSMMIDSTLKKIKLHKIVDILASDDFYKELHIKQKALLLKVVKKNLIRVSEMCEWLYEQLDITSEDETVQEIKKEIRVMLDKELVKDLLNRFYKNNGIKEVYIDPTKFKTEQDFLSDSDSPFYSEKSYNKLKAIAAEAGENTHSTWKLL